MFGGVYMKGVSSVFDKMSVSSKIEYVGRERREKNRNIIDKVTELNRRAREELKKKLGIKS
jgi:hypothetical protein